MEHPNVVETLELKFRQLKRPLLVGECPDTPFICSLAVANTYGLVFAAHSKGFSLFSINELLEPNYDIERKKIKEPVSNFTLINRVPLQEDPLCISLNCHDTILAVIVSVQKMLVVKFFFTELFGNQCIPAQPYSEVRLGSVPGLLLKELAWNPAVPEMMAVCLSDGSLMVLECSAQSTKILGALGASIGACSLCWSPKGKQLVVGKRNGILTQYKPTLQESKSLQAPPFPYQASAVSVCWISTSVFAVLFINSEDTSTEPNLVVVSVPKGATPIYSNFGDVCLGSGERSVSYWMNFIPEWKILVCTSSNSVEAAVVGLNDDQNWNQWSLEDISRAEIPLLKGQESYPIGAAIVRCIQQPVVISDQESYPPMPLLLLLSTGGLVVSFHMINIKPGIPNITGPPREFIITPFQSQGPDPGIAQTNPCPNTTQTRTVATKSKLIERFSEDDNSAGVGDKDNAFDQKFSRSEDMDRKTNRPIRMPSNHTAKAPAAVAPATSSVNQNQLTQFAQVPESPKVEDENYMKMLIEEMQEFDQEVKALASKLAKTNPDRLGNNDTIGSIRSRTYEIEVFCAEMTKTVEFLRGEISSLKGSLYDSYSAAMNAETFDMRNKDKNYLSYLRKQSLDPGSKRKLDEITELHNYLSTQIEDVQQRLDLDWEEYNIRKQKNAK